MPLQQVLQFEDEQPFWVTFTQLPNVHCCDAPHALHAAPPPPHLSVATPGWHSPAGSQHPTHELGPHFGEQPAAAQPSDQELCTIPTARPR